MPSKQEHVEINGSGIKKVLKGFSAEEAIAEYIWNGFDADATEVSISFEELGGLGALTSISISDNGFGIDHAKLKEKFKPFLASEKQKIELTGRSRSGTHGKNGFGRLTFFSFADSAKWTTKYVVNNKTNKYALSRPLCRPHRIHYPYNRSR